jgi:rhodanese-related sulfurtransferase
MEFPPYQKVFHSLPQVHDQRSSSRGDHPQSGETKRNGRFVVYRLADVLVSDFFRCFRVLAQDRLAEIERIRRRFFSEGDALDSVNRETLLERVEQKKAIVIDVRPKNEYLANHIAGALPIPLEQLKQRLSDLPRSKEVVAYCRGPFCVLAKEAVELLRSHGFRATQLEDSVQDWIASGLPVVSGEQPVRKRLSSTH